MYSFDRHDILGFRVQGSGFRDLLHSRIGFIDEMRRSLGAEVLGGGLVMMQSTCWKRACQNWQRVEGFVFLKLFETGPGIQTKRTYFLVSREWRNGVQL